MTTKTNGKRSSSQDTERQLDEFTVNYMLGEQEQVFNALLARSNFLQSLEGDNRDIDKECGYPDTSQLTVDLYYKPFYDRHPIATRVVQVEPLECWRSIPEVFETHDEETNTEFEQDWEELSLSLLSKSKYKSKEQDPGNPIWEYLKRVDILSGVGFFGVLFLGLNDGKDLREPAESREGQKLLFLRAFDESSVDIVEYETDVSNPRFGLPVRYQIEFSSPEETGGLGVVSVTRDVHWSRVIHVADNMGSNEVFGVPRMRPVFNRLWDLRKLYGGSAEMYWKGAFPGLSFETHPHLGGAVNIDTKSLKDNITNYMNGLQRYLTLKGMAAKSLAPQVVDPSPQIETQIDAICIQKGIPKRIFMGSERGELSSSQDQDTWNARLEARQNGYLTPRLVVPFVDRLIELGVLREPTEYFVEWPDLDAQSEDEKASVAIKKVHALTKFVAGDVEMIMSPIDFYTKILNLSSEEAMEILENAVEAFEESEERDLKRDIIEAKALRRHQQPAIPDDIKEALLEIDEEESVKGDALSDKFTGGKGKERAEGEKSLRKLTGVKVGGKSTKVDDDEELGEGEELL